MICLYRVGMRSLLDARSGARRDYETMGIGVYPGRIFRLVRWISKRA